MIRGILRVLIQVVFFAGVLFLPIGTWEWPRAVQFLVAFGGLSLISTVSLALKAPASLAARVERGAAKSQPRADRVVTGFLVLFHMAWFILISNDAFRWQLLPRPSMGVAIMGAVLCLTGYGIMLTAVRQNAFAAPVVGDQTERNQVLVDTGIYGRLRHPLYFGHLLFLLGLPLWLESYLGFLMVPVVLAPMVARILVEEKTLVETLPGYAAYRSRVPQRVLPFVW
jgi:protein-S-isoprenylcysteine O-methyltransferase Ste14